MAVILTDKIIQANNGNFPLLDASSIELSDGTRVETAISDLITNTASIPSNLSDLSEDSTHRTVTDADKTNWNNKVNQKSGYDLVSNANVTQISTNKSAIDTLNGADTVNGSVAKTVKDAINKFATDLSNDGLVNTYAEALDWISQHGNDYTVLLGMATNNETAINTLNGSASTSGSVAKLISDAIVDLKNNELSSVESRVNTLEAKASNGSEAKVETNAANTEITITTTDLVNGTRTAKIGVPNVQLDSSDNLHHFFIGNDDTSIVTEGSKVTYEYVMDDVKQYDGTNKKVNRLHWFIDGKDTGSLAVNTITLSTDDTWVLNGADTGIDCNGLKGDPGVSNEWKMTSDSDGVNIFKLEQYVDGKVVPNSQTPNLMGGYITATPNPGNTSSVYKLDIKNHLGNTIVTTDNLVGPKGTDGIVGKDGKDGSVVEIVENSANISNVLYRLDVIVDGITVLTTPNLIPSNIIKIQDFNELTATLTLSTV